MNAVIFAAEQSKRNEGKNHSMIGQIKSWFIQHIGVNYINNHDCRSIKPNQIILLVLKFTILEDIIKVLNLLL